jgi:superfamily II DNA/RNA helicase
VWTRSPGASARISLSARLTGRPRLLEEHLDIEHVAQVVNHDPPAEHKEYVHRTGRTGRAGKSGTAVTFVLPDQQAETGRVAIHLGYREQFEGSGLRPAPPKLAYSGRRRSRSKW